MSFINPLAGPLAQSTVGQNLEAAERVRQIRRQQDLQKNAAARDEEMEHQVESSEELRPIEDSHEHADQRKSKQHQPSADDDDSRDTEPGGLDLKA
jgi:hypothetical protein